MEQMLQYSVRVEIDCKDVPYIPITHFWEFVDAVNFFHQMKARGQEATLEKMLWKWHPDGTWSRETITICKTSQLA